MKTLLHKLKSEFRDAVIDFLWDQWVSIGVAGSSRGSNVPFVIDPEALLLATTRFAGADRRFMGEVMDWLHENGDVLSIQRIKGLVGDPGMANVSRLVGVAGEMVRARKMGWKTLLSLEKGDAVYGSASGSSRVREGRGVSLPPDTEEGCAFLFRLRYLLGVNARAEVVTWLLTHEGGHPALIAREAGWFSKSIQAILRDMVKSGLVRVQSGRREKVYELDREKWLALLAPDRCIRWFTQPPFYTGCSCIDEALAELASMSGSSPGMLSTVIHKYLDSSINLYMREAGQGGLFAGLDRMRGQVVVDAFRERVLSLCVVLREERDRLVRM